ncbi:MAG TPA: DUF4249 domain-containing protein [Williamwhitmania sp.]|nr:DUF4249 domain-containing protein [Williamwhitmania sp.]
MNQIKKIHLVAVATLLLWGCGKIEFDPGIANQNQNLLVVEGQVTDQPGMQYVKISRTASYMDGTSPTKIDDALVTVTNDGQTVVFTNSAPGYYTPPSDFLGEVGKTYNLNVLVDGKTYEASSTMNQALALDSVGTKDFEFDTKYFEINASFTDNPQKGEYFMFKYSRNGVLNDSIASWSYYDDLIANDLHFTNTRIFANIYGHVGDTVVVYTYSTNKLYNTFIESAQKSLQEPIPFMSQPGGEAVTNVSNGAVGFFLATAVRMKGTLLQH